MGTPAPLGVSAAGLPPLGDQANAYVFGSLSAIGPGRPFPYRGPMNVLIYGSINTSLATTNGSLNATVGSGTGLAAGNAVEGANIPYGTTVASISGTGAVLALPIVSLPASNMSVSGPNVTLPPGSNVAKLVGSAVTVVSGAIEQVTLPSNTTVLAVVQADVAPSLNSPGVPGIIQLSNNPTAVPPNSNWVPLDFALTASAIVTATDNAAVFTGAAIAYSGTVQLERSFNGGKRWVLCNVGGSGQLAQWTAGTPVSLTFGEPEKLVYYRVNCIAYSSGTINYHFSQTGGAAESLAVGPLTNG